MGGRTCNRWGFCVLIAVLATGCGPLRGFRNPDPVTPVDVGNTGKSNTGFTDNPNAAGALPADGISGGTVVAAGGASKFAPPVSQDPPPNGTQSPAPVPVPTTSPAPLTQPRPLQQVNGQPPMMPPATPPGYPTPPAPFADPHLRGNPTVTGGRLQLAPWEVPADRVLELTKQLDLLLAQNTTLLARLKELETLGAGREQSLAEAAREIEAVTAAAAKERQALQSQIDLLQGRIKQMEEEDIRFLEAIVEALKKLLPPEKP